MNNSPSDPSQNHAATAAADRIENHSGPLVVERRVEITGTATGPVTLSSGTLIVHGCVDGDIDVDGGDLFVFGSVTGRVTNNSGSIEVSGTVGDLRGPPAYTRVLPGAQVGDHVIGSDPGAIDSWASALAELSEAEATPLTGSRSIVEPAQPAPTPPRADSPVAEPEPQDAEPEPQDTAPAAFESTKRPLMEHRIEAPAEWMVTNSDGQASTTQRALPKEDLTDQSLLMLVNQARVQATKRLIIRGVVAAIVLLIVVFLLFG